MSVKIQSQKRNMISFGLFHFGIIFLFLLSIHLIFCDDETNLKDILELADAECEDREFLLAKASFDEAILYDNNSRNSKRKAQMNLWNYDIVERNNLLKLNVNSSHSREIELYLKRGQSNFNATQQDKLLELESSLGQLKYQLLFAEEEDDDDHNITSTEEFLRSDQDPYQKQEYWNERFTSFYKKHGSRAHQLMFELLQLLKQEALLHGHKTLPLYWEEICEVEKQGYTDMNNIWKEIYPTYQKLSNFIMRQLNVTTNSSLIPPFILGSFKGDDWSLIIPELLEPESQEKLQEFEEVLIKEESQDKLWAINRANIIISELGLETVPINEIEIASTTRCPDRVVTLCLKKSHDCTKPLGVALCSSPSYTPRWYELIEMIELLAKDAYRRTSNNSCLINYAQRYSALETAVAGAVVLRSLERSDLPENVKQLIIALRTLPALGQALIADKSRISAALDTAFGVSGVNQTFDLFWTRSQRDIFKVEGDESWQTYLVDDNIISNKPSLSKFLGLVLQFRLIKSTNLSDTLNNLARTGFSMPWPDAVKEYVILEDEKPWEPLLHYLQPLNNIIEKDGDDEPDSSENGKYTIAYACVGVILLIVVLGIAWWFWRKHTTERGRGNINSKRGRYSGAKSEEEGRELQNL